MTAETRSNRASSHPEKRVRDSVDAAASACSGLEEKRCCQTRKELLPSKHTSFNLWQHLLAPPLQTLNCPNTVQVYCDC